MRPLDAPTRAEECAGPPDVVSGGFQAVRQSVLEAGVLEQSRARGGELAQAARELSRPARPLDFEALKIIRIPEVIYGRTGSLRQTAFAASS